MCRLSHGLDSWPRRSFLWPGRQTTSMIRSRFGEQALAYSSGSIQRSTPQDGFVNVITGDNQTTGDRMILGGRDILYLRLKNPGDVAPGDLFTIYRREHKVFHPTTGQYLGYLVDRLAVVQVTQIDKESDHCEDLAAFEAISPGDPVMKFVLPTDEGAAVDQPSAGDNVEGRVVEFQSNMGMGTGTCRGAKKYRLSGPGTGRRDQAWGSNGDGSVRREPSSTGRGRIESPIHGRPNCHGADHKIDLPHSQGRSLQSEGSCS